MASTRPPVHVTPEGDFLTANAVSSAHSPAQEQPTLVAAAHDLFTQALRVGQSLLTPSGFAGVAQEAAWIATHLAMNPGGLGTGEKEQSFSTPLTVEMLPLEARALWQQDPGLAQVPILLIHGMVDNPAVFSVLAKHLQSRGFSRLISFSYPATTNDVRAAARDLAAEVLRIRRESGYRKVHLVGHSLGGLIARYYVQRLGGHESVDTLFTLGAPHQGSLLARALPVRLGRQLRPGSGLMTELTDPCPQVDTHMVAFWSDSDQLIIPAENAMIEHPDLDAVNVPLHHVGHMSLSIHRDVVHTIAMTLAQRVQGGTAAA